MLNNEGLSESSSQDFRACERVGLLHDIKLLLDDGRELFGKTQDISLSGIMMGTSHTLLQSMVRSNGQVFLQDETRSISEGFPCEVIRVKKDTIALKLSVNHATSFCLALSKDMLGRTPV